MKSSQKVITSLALLLGLGFASLAHVQAQQAAAATSCNANVVTLTAVPPRLGDDYSIVLKPGETRQIEIEVRNPSDCPITIETFARDFIIADDGETPIGVDDDVSSKWSLANWLTMTPNTVVLKERGSATVLVNITVPEDALPGGRYAMILHRPASGSDTAQATGAKVTAQVGTLLYVVVDGELVENADVADFSFTDFNEFGPIDYSFTIQNGSSLHIRPETEITVKNMLGKEIAKIDPEQKNIFPDSERKFTGTWDTNWGFGRYTADLTGTYGNQGGTLSAQTAFWIIPVRIILAILLVFVLIIAVIVTTRRKYTKMLDIEAEKVRRLDEKLDEQNNAQPIAERTAKTDSESTPKV
ncbi:MAG: hypothetical protein Q4G02_00190 [bacterium]|nr:hypothetical protein [bacterium]